MALTPDSCGAVLLAGGQSRRMGTCKALLTIRGETMLSRLSRQLEAFDERLLSANDPALAQGLPLTLVRDIYQGHGPLGGLHAALSAAKKEALFCVSCDLPNFTEELPRLMLEQFPEGADAMVCRDGTGRVHPLCGIYKKRILPVIQAQLDADERRVMVLLKQINSVYLDTEGKLPDSVFYNMNTREEFRFLRKNETDSAPESSAAEIKKRRNDYGTA